MVLHAALDISGPYASFALTEDKGEVIFSESLDVANRATSKLTVWMEELLEKHGHKLNDIRLWTVGSGPGSFTGIRISSVLVQGLAYDKKEVKSRVVPTALAMAVQAGILHGEKMGIWFDGRNSELLYFEVVSDAKGKIGPSGVEKVMDAAAVGKYFESKEAADRHIAVRTDEEAIAKLAGDYSCRFDFIDRLDAAAFFALDLPFDNDLTKLEYLRPAVHTK